MAPCHLKILTNGNSVVDSKAGSIALQSIKSLWNLVDSMVELVELTLQCQRLNRR